MTFLYKKDAAGSAEAKAFLLDQDKLQAKWRKELHLTQTAALNYYNLLEWCDALSLLLCKGELQEDQRSIEISTGPDKKTYVLKKIAEGEVTVEPWPFEPSEFRVNYDVRQLSEIGFTSSAHFRKTFLGAAVTGKSWLLKQQGTSTSGQKAKSKLKK